MGRRQSLRPSRPTVENFFRDFRANPIALTRQLCYMRRVGIEADRHELHAKVDADCDVRLRQLEEEARRIEEERRQGHEWVNSVPSSLLGLFLSDGMSQPAPHRTEAAQPMFTEPLPSNGASHREKDAFPLRAHVRDYVYDLPAGTRLSMPSVYEALETRLEWVRTNPKPSQVRARIATTLSKLAEDGLIEIIQRGTASYPHIYVRTEKDAIIPADSISVGGAPEGEKQTALI